METVKTVLTYVAFILACFFSLACGSAFEGKTTGILYDLFVCALSILLFIPFIIYCRKRSKLVVLIICSAIYAICFVSQFISDLHFFLMGLLNNVVFVIALIVLLTLFCVIPSRSVLKKIDKELDRTNLSEAAFKNKYGENRPHSPETELSDFWRKEAKRDQESGYYEWQSEFWESQGEEDKHS